MIWILFTLLWILICHKLATDNGRDKNWAILMGLLFGIFAVFTYLIIGKKNA